MAKAWSKGLTKETHPSLQKTSDTMKRKKLDNFAKWRVLAKQAGRIKSSYDPIPKNGDLAELVGVILGDGHIEKFPRTERLLIFSNSANQGFVERYAQIVRKAFQREPYVYKQNGQNCTRISLYEKEISKRIDIPVGSRKNLKVTVPKWVLEDRDFIVRYLRGLYEAEGSHSVHLPTSTYKFSFSNLNPTLLQIVYDLMRDLGFHPSIDKKRVQISRKAEVAQAIELLRFRDYSK